MNGLVFLAGFTVIGVAICALVLWGTRGDSNEWPGIGDNLGGSGLVWWRRRWDRWRTPVPSADEAMGPHYDLRSVDRRLGQGAHPHHARSWMEQPGAFERTGLVDQAPPDPEAR